MKVIGLAGPRRAGKSTAAAHLASARSAYVLTNSEVLWRVLEILNIPVSRDSLARVGEALLRTFGNGLMAQANVAAIREAKPAPSIVVIDGIRTPEEVAGYRAEYPRAFRLVFIDSSPELRYERALTAQDPSKMEEQELTRTKFEAQEKHFTESFLPDLRNIADAVITNDGDVGQLRAKVEELLDLPS